MAIDASIYNAFKPETYGQRQERMMREQAAAQEREFNALRLQGAKQELADKDRMRQESLAVQNALMGATTDDDRISRLTALGTPTAWGQADTLRKGILERQKTDAELRDKNAQASEREFKMKREQLQDVLNAVSSSKDQNSYMQSLMMLKSRGYDLTGVPEVYDPAVVQRFGQQALTAAQRLEQEWKSKDFNLKANNELIGPDGKVNTTLHGLKIKQAAAGAARVNVNTDNLGLKPKDRFEMEGKLSDDYKSVTKLDSGVLAATSKISTALTKDGALKDQAAIYSFAKMLDPEGAVREADYAAIANTAGAVDRVKNYANRLLTGEYLTPTQRKEMVDMAQAFEKVAKDRISKAQRDYSTQAQRYNLRPEAVYGSVPEDAPAPRGNDATDVNSLVEKYRSKK